MNPSKHSVEVELDHILSSPQIGNSTVLSDFLRFIVTETLEGRSDELKEYTIGINVLKREADFNPQIDSIVRIHAGRLRRALKEYYYEDGKHHDIIIDVPKGGYVPYFTQQNGENAVQKNSANSSPVLPVIHLVRDPLVQEKLTLAVLPLKGIGTESQCEPFSRSLSEYLSTELTMFRYINVKSYHSVDAEAFKSGNLRQVGNATGADYILTGGVQCNDQQVRVWIQLCNKKGDQLWGHTFKKSEDGGSLWDFQDHILAYLIAHLTGLQGMLLRDQFSLLSDKEDDANPVLTPYWYSKFDENYTEEFTTRAVRFYRGLIEREPENGLAHAYLAKILVGESLLFPEANGNTEEGYHHAQRALKTDPHCQQGYIAMAAVLLLKNERSRCITLLEQGLKINPHNFDYQNSMGALLCGLGEFDKGGRLLQKNYQLNQNNLLRWHKLFYCYYLFHMGYYTETIAILDRIEIPRLCSSIVKVSCYACTERYSEARNLMETLEKQHPDLTLSTVSGLNKVFHSAIFVEDIIASLNKLKIFRVENMTRVRLN